MSKENILRSELNDIVDRDQYVIEIQNYYNGHDANSKKLEWSNDRVKQVKELLENYKLSRSQGKRITNQEYYHARKYELIDDGNEQILILKRKEKSDPMIKIVSTEDYYQIILDAHIETKHGRRDKIINFIRDKYMIPIFAVTILINMCKICVAKKMGKKASSIRPSSPSDLAQRGWIDLVDFQMSPDEEYKWLLHYQDHVTQFCFLRPLKSNDAKELAIEILKIFLQFGYPNILNSSYGNEFTVTVLKEITNSWPACRIVSGSADYANNPSPNHDLKNLIQTWMKDNKSTNWSFGCYFIQFQINSSHNSTIGKTPHKALFGVDPKLGQASTSLSKTMITSLQTEEVVVSAFGANNGKQNEENDQITRETPKVSTTDNIELDTKINEQEDVPTVGHQVFIVNQSNVSNNLLRPRRSEMVIVVNNSLTTDIKEQSAIPEILISSSSVQLNSIKQEHNDDENTLITSNTVTNSDDECDKINDSMCNICNNEATGSHRCVKCNLVVHKICGVVLEGTEGSNSQLICNMCVNDPQINLKRNSDYTIPSLTKKFKEDIMNAPSYIKVEVPNIDHNMPMESNNISGEKTNNDLYGNDTSIGITKDRMIQIASSSSSSTDPLLIETTGPFGSIAVLSSSISDQESKKCSCKKVRGGQCVSYRCNCKKNNVPCNSRCHSSLMCNNNNK